MDGAVALVPVTAANWRAALGLRVTPAQLPFVADHQPVAAVALAKAYVGAMGHVWSPMLILGGPVPVGFLALTHPASDPGQAWVFHFFIDHRHQRQGHARAAMGALLTLLRNRVPGVGRVNLLVHPQNAAARGLYGCCGFALTNRVVDGDLEMALPLN